MPNKQPTPKPTDDDRVRDFMKNLEDCGPSGEHKYDRAGKPIPCKPRKEKK